MPVLTIPNSFTANTLIKSAEVNANFASISTLLNATKLDMANLQNFTVVPFDDQAMDPATPAAGTINVYQKDRALYIKDEFGVVTPVGSGAGGGGSLNYITQSGASSDFDADIAGWNGAAAGVTTAAMRTYAAVATITIASPGVVTKVGHGLSAAHPILFTTTSALPIGITGGVTYYAKPIDADTFTISATPGGANIDTSGSQSGVHTMRPLRPTTATPTAAPASTFARTTSSPLRGTGSGLITKTAVISTGDSNEVAITIDAADQAKVLTVSCDYSVSSGFVASNGTVGSPSDIQFFIIDTGNSNALIPLTPSVITGSSLGSYNFSGVFQTSANSTTYKLVMLVATNNGSAYTMKIDAVSVGPQSYSQGGAGPSDWVPSEGWTFTGLGTIGTLTLFERFEGDTLCIRGTVGTGTVQASTFSAILPPKYRIDDQKYSNGANQQRVGIIGPLQTGIISGETDYALFYDGSTTDRVFYSGGYAANLFSKDDGNAYLYSSSPVCLEFSLPIAGMGGSSRQSSDAATRVVAANAYTSSNSAIGPSNPGVFQTTISDTHGAYNSVTGQFTVPVSGYYQVSAFLNLSALCGSINVYKNNVKDVAIGYGSSNFLQTVTGIIQCQANDVIDVRTEAAVTNNGSGANADSSTLSIHQIQGPANIQVVESVVAAYGRSSNQVIAGNNDPVLYNSKQKDTHSAYNTATGVFTVPISGDYRVSIVTATFSNNDLYVKKNGTGFAYLTGTTASITASGTAIISCLAGDTLGVCIGNADTINGPGPAGFLNYLSINREGN